MALEAIKPARGSESTPISVWLHLFALGLRGARGFVEPTTV